VSTRNVATVTLVLLSIALVVTLSVQWLNAERVSPFPCFYAPRANPSDQLSLPEPMPTMCWAAPG
jgi:hypothetical protein